MAGVTYTQETASSVLDHLAEGRSLRAVCRDIGMAPSTVLGWCETYPDFGEQYLRTRARAYQLLADEIIEISDDATGDKIVDDEGNVKTDAERVARSKLRVDSRKWMLSKMLPKVYGDKLDVTVEDVTDRAALMRQAREKRLSES